MASSAGSSMSVHSFVVVCDMMMYCKIHVIVIMMMYVVVGTRSWQLTDGLQRCLEYEGLLVL